MPCTYAITDKIDATELATAWQSAAFQNRASGVLTDVAPAGAMFPQGELVPDMFDASTARLTRRDH
ncbi:hypothetical protein [Agromyces sp. GXS1127]|uniref:hypothetical protein n=1 Tax=Agromyces sp. GXS1127 TaxID=3424181 RepID=UPI003D317653